MLDLTTPTDHQDPYQWAVVLWAHCVVGIILLVLSAWLTGAVWLCAAIVTVGYWLFWEMHVQKQSRANLDAAIDAFGVASGVLIVCYLLQARIDLAAWACLSLLLVTGIGVWRRS